MKTVCGAQNECIDALKNLMNTFLKNNTEGYTKVFPLSIPTGWGKTRIAIQSILKAVSGKQANVILWPQNQGHIERIWQNQERIGDWMGSPKKKYFFIPCWNLLSKDVGIKDFRYYFFKRNKKKVEPSDCNEKSFEPYRNVKFFWTSNRSAHFNGDVNVLRKNLGSDPIFYIIDEWHSFDLINKFHEECEKRGIKHPSKKQKQAEKFWRNSLLFGNCKKNKLFVLLLSATPIASADAMDKIFDKADSPNINTDFDDEDAAAKQAVESDLELFNIMTQVNTNQTLHKAHTVFPDVLEKRSDDLKKLQDKNGKKYKAIRKLFPLDLFANEYISMAKKIANSKIKFPYQREQSVFAEEDSLKVKILKTFLKRIKKSQRILIFCHHRPTVAEKLEKSLKKDKDIKDKIIYLNKDASNSKISDYIDDFNSPKGKVRYLIVTDMYSQGIDLQKTNAWILHYELAWNPIRIIQRFGRVWRMNNPGKKKDELSHPLAFYMPFSYSSEEEQLNRLRRRWKTISEILPNNNKLMKPIDFEIALGIRLTPEPEIVLKK